MTVFNTYPKDKKIQLTDEKRYNVQGTSTGGKQGERNKVWIGGEGITADIKR